MATHVHLRPPVPEQALYKRVCEYMELDDRVEVLNNRLMVRCPQSTSCYWVLLLNKHSRRSHGTFYAEAIASTAPGLATLEQLINCYAGCQQVLQEMLDMLRDHSNNAHSARLEWCAGGSIDSLVSSPMIYPAFTSGTREPPGQLFDAACLTSRGSGCG